MRRYLVVILSALIVASVSCKKKIDFSSDSSLNITLSADTITFDTVFTSIGSSTRILMIYNNTDKNIKINTIRLAEGKSSCYSVNIDGESGTSFNDMEICSGDSLYTFIKVTIDPTNNPFFVEDRLIFNTNGNENVVHLTAFGQDAKYIIGDKRFNDYYKYKVIADSLAEVHWTADTTYVVYGVALINSYGTLYIEPGTHVYFHNGSGLWSWSEGQLVVRGTASDPVVFQGDRLEAFYRDEPGQWDRIWLMEARENHGHNISHAIIRNGYIGIQLERFLKDNLAPAFIDNTIIENHTGMGIYANCYSLRASNFVVANCGNVGVYLTGGGSYLFNHGTVTNFWNNSTRNTPTLYFSNIYQNPTDGNAYAYPFEFEMNNSIMYGSLENEFLTEFYSAPDLDTAYVFNNCLLRTKRWNEDLFKNCKLNEDPKLKNYSSFDYHLDTLSPAIGLGDPSHSSGDLQFDLDGVDRGNTPDAGAYQYIYVPQERQ